MHVLVIGGTRFAGYLTTWRLLAAGHRVTLLNRGTLPDPFGERVDRLRADRTTPAFARVVAGRRFDAVVDFAAYRGRDVARLIDALGDHAGHYVMISSGQVYLVKRDYQPGAGEDDYDGPLRPRPVAGPDLPEWEYGIGKREGEDALAAAWTSKGFRGTRLRIPMVNGERDHYQRVQRYLARILDGGPVLVPGAEREARHVYGGAVARAVVSLLGREDTFGKAYNFCQAETVTLAELVGELAGIAGAPARVVPVDEERVRAAGLDPVAISPYSTYWMSRIDPARARSELGLTHEPLSTYLASIVAAYLAHPAPPPGLERRAAELRLAASL